MDSIAPQPTLIQLDASIAAIASSQAKAEGFSDLSEYVRRVILDQLRQKALAPLEAELLMGVDSTDLIADDHFWSELNENIDAALRVHLQAAAVAGLRSQPKHIADEAFWESIDRSADEMTK